MTEHDIFAVYPRKGYECSSLAVIRVAMESVPAELLYELTRRYSESWRDCPDTEIPYAHEFYRRKIYFNQSLWGPRRVGKYGADRPLYEQVDVARAHGAPDVKLEAEELRKI